MNGYSLTKVFEINGKLVVADSLEQAIGTYRLWAPDVEITEISQKYAGQCIKQYNALIAEQRNLSCNFNGWKLTHITFTGVDDETDFNRLVSIQQRYPKVEFGVLVSRKWFENGKRYLSPFKAKELRGSGLRLSAHLCGSIARDVLKTGGFSNTDDFPEIIDIFSRMGFTLAEGPEVDDDLHVFTKLNFAADHPARDMQDTFFVETNPNDVAKNVILRSHTSNDQAHYMETHEPPIRVICPGRVYRNEAISARAHCFFHQVEGLYVDKNVSFTDLKQVLLTFAREMFGADTKIRLRPSYFPFTEPSAEMDVSCTICGGKGCSLCKGEGWLEILGCGMVDPNVLDACGIDSKVYSGYAFGMGVERITNLKYRVSDLRMFSENDTRFLEEFTAAN